MTETIERLMAGLDAKQRAVLVCRLQGYTIEEISTDKNIDAVTITVPDHMHAIIALACMERGKGVYLQKPLTRTPWESRVLTQAAAKYKVATQMGNQAYSLDSSRVAAEIIWSGEIGDVTEVRGSTLAPSLAARSSAVAPGRESPGNTRLGLVVGLRGHAPVQFANERRHRALELAGADAEVGVLLHHLPGGRADIVAPILKLREQLVLDPVVDPIGVVREVLEDHCDQFEVDRLAFVEGVDVPLEQVDNLIEVLVVAVQSVQDGMHARLLHAESAPPGGRRPSGRHDRAFS